MRCFKCWQKNVFIGGRNGRYIVIATTNVKHMERFTEAQKWKNINK
ncbi:MAG: hypothetical protein ACREPR_00200 [Brasilonema sp.]